MAKSSLHIFGHFIEGVRQELGNFRSAAFIHVWREANSAAYKCCSQQCNKFCLVERHPK